MSKITVGSICSGIEAASVAWKGLPFEFKWFSEIGEFQSKLLKNKYPQIPNLGDMTLIPDMIINEKIIAPDLICGGTPCQAFSLAGWKNGLEDTRGNLTLAFVDIVEANDDIRLSKGLKPTKVLWENVEGVLSDKTNAFGIFVSSLADLDITLDYKKMGKSGMIRGNKRKVVWRVLDAKYFGVPQQRKRVYVVAGALDEPLEDILLELSTRTSKEPQYQPKTFTKNKVNYEVFREYTDCLYAAYGTKWNGNAAAYNGSLFIVQDERIRRLTPLECERLMGFSDNYTNIEGAKNTNRYQAIGNSWAVPVIKWIGERIISDINTVSSMNLPDFTNSKNKKINTEIYPNSVVDSNMIDIVDKCEDERLFLSERACAGILIRKERRGIKINTKLESYLMKRALE